ncbi:MAG: 2-C-methyl-D-erythritol 4-phosphate cytidylyltransferase [Tepidisphaera sp.]
MEIAVIIAAAGASTRYSQASGNASGATGGIGRHKLEEDLGGKTVLHRAVEVFSKHDDVKHIVIAGPHEEEAYAEFRRKHGDRLGLLGAVIVRGGKTHRYESVAAALAAVPASATHIAVHDAARPCLDPRLLESVVEMARTHAAVIPAVACADTVKRVRVTDEPRAVDDDPIAAILGASPKSGEKLSVVEETLDRSSLVLVQTPQVFRAELLRRAYAQKDLSSTDDAGLVERLGLAGGGERVAICPGDPRNIKITTPEDLTLARAILNVKPPEAKSALHRF